MARTRHSPVRVPGRRSVHIPGPYVAETSAPPAGGALRVEQFENRAGGFQPVVEPAVRQPGVAFRQLQHQTSYEWVFGDRRIGGGLRDPLQRFRLVGALGGVPLGRMALTPLGGPMGRTVERCGTVAGAGVRLAKRKALRARTVTSRAVWYEIHPNSLPCRMWSDVSGVHAAILAVGGWPT